MTSPRPSVSVIVPFAGTAEQLGRLLGDLQRISLGPDDELIVADNRRRDAGTSLDTPLASGVRIQLANELPGPAFARNRGAAAATGEWLVFIDADTRPDPGLLEAFFDPPPRPATAILGGTIMDVAQRQTLVARHDVARGRMGQNMTLRRRGTPYVQTANCAVRRSAFEAVGGFEDRGRGEDADLCFRLRRGGWELEERPRARVEHQAKETFRAWLSQQFRHAASAAWLNRRWPGEFPAPGMRLLVNRTLHLGGRSVISLVRGDTEEAGFALLDLIRVFAFQVGRLGPKRVRGWNRG
jgi:GT2 family glycosyltransferase